MQFTEALECPRVWALILSELSRAQTHLSMWVVSVCSKHCCLGWVHEAMAVQRNRLVPQGTWRPGCGQDQLVCRLKPKPGTQGCSPLSDKGQGPGAGSSPDCLTPGVGSVPRVQGWELLRVRGPGLGDYGWLPEGLVPCLSLGSPGVSSCLCPCIQGPLGAAPFGGNV